MTRQVFAGVDGGGTKTEVVLVDATGEEIGRAIAPTSNAALVGHERAGQVLQTLLRDAMASLPEPATLARVWCGLSGSDRPEDHALLRPFLTELSPNIRLSNDAELVLGALDGGIGVAVVSGTGSIAFGQNADGSHARAGGWGQIFGDEGSGYDIACRMLDAFARETDGRGPVTSCTARLSTRFELENPHQIITWVYERTTSKADLAALSSIVVEEAAGGDEVAQTILAESAMELANTAAAVARRLGFADRLPLVLTGGNLVHNATFRSIVIDSLSLTWPRLDVKTVSDPALTAAQAMSRPTDPGARRS